MFGWLGSHTNGLFADEAALLDDADMSGEKSIEDQYVRGSGRLQTCTDILTMHLKSFTADTIFEPMM